MGAEQPVRTDLRINGPAAAGTPSRSPLASKQARPRGEGEASLCAIKITRESVRAGNQRAEPREEAEAAVAMEFRGEQVGATVLNISSKGAMIRCAIEPVIGEPLELTFPGDERIEGLVRWVRDGCIGVEFGGPGRAAPAQAPAPPAATPPLRQLKLVEGEPVQKAATDDADDPAGNRSVRRARVLLAAKLMTSRGALDARLRDLSCKGALLECSDPLEIGDAVVFSRGETIVPARVAWTSRERVGIEFDRPIAESEVLVHVNRPVAPPPQAQTPPPPPDPHFRRPNFSERMTDYDRKLARVIGASLGVKLIDE